VTDTIWRIDKARHAPTTKTGEGARMTGGRWTSPGHPAIYCAEHLSLAILEVLVHAPDPSQRSAPRVRFRIRLDRTLVERVADRRLPVDFSPRTPYAITRAIGDAWLQTARNPALSVPSAIVPAERNYILNPRHPQFDSVAWDAHEPITLDDRLWKVGA
jgi:RES domain-containing protein